MYCVLAHAWFGAELDAAFRRNDVSDGPTSFGVAAEIRISPEFVQFPFLFILRRPGLRADCRGGKTPPRPLSPSRARAWPGGGVRSSRGADGEHRVHRRRRTGAARRLAAQHAHVYAHRAGRPGRLGERQLARGSRRRIRDSLAGVVSTTVGERDSEAPPLALRLALCQHEG